MYLETAAPDAICDCVRSMDPGEDDVVIILLGEENAPPVEEFAGRLAAMGIRFCGGIFPGILHGTTHSRHGAIVHCLPALAPPILITGLDRDRPPLPDLFALPLSRREKPPTALLFVDGMAPAIGSLLSGIYHQLGASVHFLGAGAGSATLTRMPCVFTAEGCFENAAVILFTGCSSRLEVRHGWEYLTGPLVATRTQGNVIEELNWQPAFDVYREALLAHAGEDVSRDRFFETAKAHPFGIIREGSEYIVRDPIRVGPAGEIMCVGEIPENAVLSVLQGDHRSLVAAARTAAAMCSAGHTPGEACKACFVIDCISRVLFLGESFQDEVNAICEAVRTVPEAPLTEGVLSLGEISSTGEGLLEFYNKTCVIGALK